MTPHFDDNDFVVLFRNQEVSSIRKLYDTFYRPLCYYAEKIVNNQQEAEDIVVETFLKLIRKCNDFEKFSEMKSFLYTTTKNASIDYLRKIKRQQQAQSELLYLSELKLNDDLELINTEVLAMLYEEIENLPPQCAGVFKLLFFGRLSSAEVAHQMNISVKTVLNQKGKAIQLLRKAFLEKGILSIVAFLSLIK